MKKMMGRGIAFFYFLILIIFSGFAPHRVEQFKFSENFLWGAATAAHQVEGGNIYNDWYQAEQRGQLKEAAGHAADFWNRYEDDLKIAKDLQHTTFRMSIEWSRIEPKAGKFDLSAIEHYRKILFSARSKGMKTFLTLHHFTTPIWVSNQGGWANPQAIEWFLRFCTVVVPRLGDLVDFWITFNEPTVMMLLGYVSGNSPPFKKNQFKEGAVVLAHLLKAHARTYHLIHKYYLNAQVSISHHIREFAGARKWNPIDALVSKIFKDFWNHAILKAIKTGEINFYIPFLVDYSERYSRLAGTLDFLGLNYYSRDLIRLNLSSENKVVIKSAPDSAQKSELGWEIYPEGFYNLLLEMHGYGWPIYITENGIADSKDIQRKEFICSHLKEMVKAMQDGVDVRGYIYWALIDNYEWSLGYFPRFGLVEVDYATQKRTIRESAYTFQKIIQTKTLDACLN